ncbi:hypothetical protein SAY87_017150 [Trapa incisa]|uniref:Uncharacterized protein n=1 Tax=Trapa incisa TaxID=236973 RepID=A0AAN7LAJ8_9MYRT|nr:hypothetical protein SAY87_017150 [Trapa incisa]
MGGLPVLFTVIITGETKTAHKLSLLNGRPLVLSLPPPSISPRLAKNYTRRKAAILLRFSSCDPQGPITARILPFVLRCCQFEELSVMSPLLGAEEGGTSDVTKVVGISSLKDSPDGLSSGLKERNSLIVPQLIAQRF